MNLNKLGDIKINGIGSSNGGSFEKVDLNGKGTVNGDIECVQFECNGVGAVKGNVKSQLAKINGTAKITGKLAADQLFINGAASIHEGVDANKMDVSGKASVSGPVKGHEIKVNGKLSVKGNCDAEEFSGEGAFSIDGLLNAENIQVKLFSESKAKEIGGKKIIILQHKESLFKFLKSFFHVKLQAELIEGDEIELEGTVADIVRGKHIKIGKNCEIDLVEYSGDFFMEKNAQVKEYRKL
ncbi:polymer-forming cytoskeletal protein [Falsibacillus albus]|uniref:Cytoplasmic protein n=1 Tax=Falsibacillus albus TaxID=2478915 RepID=A0A3L7K2P0_9BACI|nr:polymer-forming cytoskeletal protein [Falsibacillus albus]RLQ96251.1 cytoplasmic protein [Falsibacillus albus]